MPDDPLIGTLLGQYRIESVVGKGGMATVYRGIQVAVNRVVAVKVLPGTFMHDETFMTRFRQEAEVAAQLEHIRILPLYDYGEHEGIPFMVMRFIEGGTLRQRTQGGPIPADEAVRIISQVAEGLDYAHMRHVIHRDLKPSNIMIDADGNSYLSDFGTAKLRDRSAQLTGSGIVGTPAYMAPEQSMPGQVTPAVDIYALGVTLFEMITGQVPYAADTPIVQILMHIQHPVPSLMEYNPTATAEVDVVVKRAMAKRPDDRYARALDLAAALRVAVEAAGGWSADFELPDPGARTQLPMPEVPANGLRFLGGWYENGNPQAGDLAGQAEDPTPVDGIRVPEGLQADIAAAINDQQAARPGDPFQPDTGVLMPSDRSAPEFPAPDAATLSSAGRRARRRAPVLLIDTGDYFELASSNVLIGRSDPKKGIFVDIDLTGLDTRRRSSRNHARILERDGMYILWDLRSLNGTYVNGQRLPEGGRQELRDDDVIQFGKDGGVTLVFQM